jgi:hypothetical protein
VVAKARGRKSGEVSARHPARPAVRTQSAELRCDLRGFAMTSLYRDSIFPLDPLCVPCQIARGPGAARAAGKARRRGMLDLIALGIGGFAVLGACGARSALL